MSVLRKASAATKDVAASVPPGWLGSSYRDLILTQEPLAYWGLDDPPGSTSAVDSSGNGRPLTYLAGVTLGAPGLVGTGTAASRTTAGGVARLDGAEWMDVPDVTLEAVINYQSRTDYRQIIDRHQRSEGTFQFRVTKTTGRLEFIFWTNAGGPYFVNGATALTVGVPYHVAATFDGAQGRVFVNGVQDGSFAVAGRLKAGSDHLHVGVSMGGTSSASTNLWLGVIDEVAYYGQALSATELRAHAVAAGLGGDD